MNKQRKVLVTITYNELGIIINTKTEEVAQPERILYANMSDAEFEQWLYEHGICNPNIHESIPCGAVPLLIDNAISEWPSAQLERKRGKWIRNDNGTYSCSVCQSWIPEEQRHYARYCLHCGVDMRGEQDETD